MSKEKTKAIKKKASRRQKKDWIAAYIFIAPVTIGLLIFYVWPFIQNFWFSFNDVNKFNMATFCGLDNYKTPPFLKPLNRLCIPSPVPK